jgi:uncharacterized protein (TIGR03546 family)
VVFFYKLIRSIIKALHSDGTPGQVAAGIAMGAIIGLTPLLSLHNALVAALILLLNVSVPGAMLGWLACLPLGFLLDPLFDALGRALLMGARALAPFWTWSFNRPVIPLSNLNNSVMLGSLVIALILFVPLFYGSRWGVTRYRATVAERIRRSPVFKAWKASKLYSVYQLFQPRT